MTRPEPVTWKVDELQSHLQEAADSDFWDNVVNPLEYCIDTSTNLQDPPEEAEYDLLIDGQPYDVVVRVDVLPHEPQEGTT